MTGEREDRPGSMTGHMEAIMFCTDGHPQSDRLNDRKNLSLRPEARPRGNWLDDHLCGTREDGTGCSFQTRRKQ